MQDGEHLVWNVKMKTPQEEYDEVFDKIAEKINEKYKIAAKAIQEANEIMYNSFENFESVVDPVDIAGLDNVDVKCLKYKLDYRQIMSSMESVGWTHSSMEC